MAAAFFRSLMTFPIPRPSEGVGCGEEMVSPKALRWGKPSTSYSEQACPCDCNAQGGITKIQSSALPTADQARSPYFAHHHPISPALIKRHN